MTNIKIVVLALFAVSFLPVFGVNTDTIPHKHIHELTVYSLSSGQFNLPSVVVDHKTIESSSFVTPADALRNHPGISMVRDGIWTTSLNIRGMSEQRLLF